MEKRFSFEERPYQTQAVTQVLEGFAEGKDSILLESPVGSGKTIMGLMVIKALQDEAGGNLRVNWVASRKHILNQTKEINDSHFHCDINYVSVFNSNPPKADMVVLDEAHHEATQSCLEMYENTGNAKTLGLSATPLRTDRMRLSFQKTVRCSSIQQLINLGVLSQYHSYKLPEWSAEYVGNIFCLHPEKWGKTIAFFHTIHECRVFQNILLAHGISCEVVTGQSNKDAQLEAFINNEYQVIANVSVLSEGFDLPELQSVFLRDSSRLPMIQMAGRGLRRAPQKTHCNIVQSETSAYQIERIADSQESFRYIKGHWLSCSGDTAIIAAVLNKSFNLLAKRNNQLPRYLSTSKHIKEVTLKDRPRLSTGRYRLPH